MRMIIGAGSVLSAILFSPLEAASQDAPPCAPEVCVMEISAALQDETEGYSGQSVVVQPPARTLPSTHFEEIVSLEWGFTPQEVAPGKYEFIPACIMKLDVSDGGDGWVTPIDEEYGVPMIHVGEGQFLPFHYIIDNIENCVLNH